MKKISKFLSIITLVVLIISSIPFTPQADVDSYVHFVNAGIFFGDVNESGAVDSSDALVVLQHSVGKITLDQSKLIIADVSADDDVTSSDALLILQHAVGKISTFPAGDVIEESSADESSADNGSSDVTSNPDEGGSGDDTSNPDDVDFVPVSADEYLTYKQLSSVQQSVYDIAYENVKEASVEVFSVGSARNVSVADMMVGVQAMLYDHPELFWAMTSFAYSSVSYGNRIVQFYNGSAGKSTYIYEPSTLEDMKIALEAKIDEIFAETINPTMSEYEIALALHDWIVENTTYNYDAANGLTTTKDAWSAYAALVDGTAVCEGLSKAYQLLLYRAGINCGLAIGPGHMWNYVDIDDEWYYTDVTWADLDLPGVPLYHFFNQTTEVFSNSREFCPNINTLSTTQLSSIVSSGALNFNFNVPTATATNANWFVKNEVYFEDVDDFSANINQKMADFANGGKRYIQVMIEDKYFTSFDEINVYTTHISLSEVNGKILSYEDEIYSYTKRFKSYACGFIITW